ncbi:family 16 glycosyl hydrolase [Exidia glandulosa HHB12029]|uniref:Family 16 glycosyl hydrolase n=1 Tax=Exidia glandulosa HHB12029 TaxID=1314781 RepID=A0A165GP67_EXIGL|nr:family 16 glycosyl hydrolase [Exidia glandulosa HHB12029]
MHGFTTLSFASAVLVAVLSFSPLPAAATQSHAIPSSSTRHHRRGVPTYKLTQNLKGKNFYDAFDFFTDADPTGGLVNYQSLADARAKNLTHADAGSFVIRGDMTTKLVAGQKRDSVRIESKRAYKTHLQVFDVAHMPEGKGTWPAYWMSGDNWPYNGELDILEGANDIGPNLISLHTGPNCTMPEPDSLIRVQKGSIKANDCFAYATGSNTGCGVFGDSKRDFGPALNKAGGGWFVTERRPEYIKVWFWSHQDKNVPAVVKNGGKVIDSSKFGRPTASFPGTSCSLGSQFGPNKIIINLTYCGGFAGHTFLPGGTPECEKFVAENPVESSGKAYWNIRSLRIYE